MDWSGDEMGEEMVSFFLELNLIVLLFGLIAVAFLLLELAL